MRSVKRSERFPMIFNADTPRVSAFSLYCGRAASGRFRFRRDLEMRLLRKRSIFDVLCKLTVFFQHIQYKFPVINGRNLRKLVPHPKKEVNTMARNGALVPESKTKMESLKTEAANSLNVNLKQG